MISWLKTFWLWLLTWGCLTIAVIFDLTPAKKAVLSDPIFVAIIIIAVVISYLGLDKPKYKQIKYKYNPLKVEQKADKLIQLGVFNAFLWKYDIEEIHKEIINNSNDKKRFEIPEKFDIFFTIIIRDIEKKNGLLEVFLDFKAFLSKIDIHFSIGLYDEKWNQEFQYWEKRSILIDDKVHDYKIDTEQAQESYFSPDIDNSIFLFQGAVNKILENSKFILVQFEENEILAYILVEKGNENDVKVLREIMRA